MKWKYYIDIPAKIIFIGKLRLRTITYVNFIPIGPLGDEILNFKRNLNIKII